ncbi:MAG: hypothetical protein ABJB86_21575 [Bacteroidota bacterium]
MMANPCSDIETFIAALEKRRDQLIDIVADRQAQGLKTGATRRQIKELQAQILQELILLQKCKKQVPGSVGDSAKEILFTLDVYIINIHYTGPGYNDILIDKTASIADILMGFDKLLQAFPISHINIAGIQTFEWGRELKFDENREALVEVVNDLRNLAGSNALYIGMLPEAAGYSGFCNKEIVDKRICLLSASPDAMVSAMAPVIESLKIFSDQYADQLAGEKRQADYYHLGFQRDHLQQQVILKNAFHLYQDEPAKSLATSTGIRAYFYSNDNILMYSSYTNSGTAAQPGKVVSSFQLSFPRMENMQRIQLVENNFSIGEFYIAPAAPQVNITGTDFREEGENYFLHLTWEGSAAGYVQPALVYAVRYSADGLQWQVIESGIYRNCCKIKLNELPGGTACRMQVIASAGLLTSVAETWHFSLPVKARQIYWLHPAPKSVYVAGQPVHCAATAYSSNFNNVLPEEIIWNSLKLGYLGTGQQLSVCHLSRGKDWIQVHIPDGLGNLLTQQVEISIV